jgi:hypothetical protein
VSRVFFSVRSLSSSPLGDSTSAEYAHHPRQQQQHNNITALPTVLRPPPCLNDGSPQNGTPAGYMCPFFREDTPPVSAAGGSGGIVGVNLLPVFTIGLIALLWVWILDETKLPARLRRGTTFEKEVGQKGACRCRCRVCTLRIQARGQPLHDVRDGA